MSEGLMALTAQYKKARINAIRAKVIETATRPKPITAPSKKQKTKKTDTRTTKKKGQAHDSKGSPSKPASRNKSHVSKHDTAFSDSGENDDKNDGGSGSSGSEKSGSDSEGSPEGEAYEVAKLLDHKLVEEDNIMHTEYLVQWKPVVINGKRKKFANTWEPEANLKSCEFRLAEYRQKKKMGQVRSVDTEGANADLSVNEVYNDLLSKEPHPVSHARHNKLWDQAQNAVALQLEGRKRRRRATM